MNRFNLGGPTYNATYLSRFMQPDFQTLLIGGLKDEDEENSEFVPRSYGLHPVTIESMRRSIGLKDIKAFFALRHVIKKYKPDIVHTHAAKAGLLGRLAAWTCGVPVIVHTFHGHVFDKYFSRANSLLYQFLERLMAKVSSRIVVISENQYEDIVNKYKICKPKKAVIVPLGFDLSKFAQDREAKRREYRKAWGIDDDEIAIGIIGRLAPIKNHKFFLDAVALLMRQTDKRVRIFIIGDGSEHAAIEKHAQQLELSYANGKDTGKATITFTSWERDVDCATAGMDIIALSSLNEGTPVSLIEAQAAGKPIVSTNVGGISNIVIPNKTALLVDMGDTEGYAMALLKMVENEQLRKEMSVAGIDFVNERFHYTRLVNDMRKVYMDLLQQKKVI